MAQDNPTPVEGQTSANQPPESKVEAAVAGAGAGEKPQNPAEEKAMTREEFAARRDELFARARAVGLRPLQEVALDLARRGLAAFDGFLSGLEGGDPRKKR